MPRLAPSLLTIRLQTKNLALTLALTLALALTILLGAEAQAQSSPKPNDQPVNYRAVNLQGVLIGHLPPPPQPEPAAPPSFTPPSALALFSRGFNIAAGKKLNPVHFTESALYSVTFLAELTFVIWGASLMLASIARSISTANEFTHLNEQEKKLAAAAQSKHQAALKKHLNIGSVLLICGLVLPGFVHMLVNQIKSLVSSN